MNILCIFHENIKNIFQEILSFVFSPLILTVSVETVQLRRVSFAFQPGKQIWFMFAKRSL